MFNLDLKGATNTSIPASNYIVRVNKVEEKLTKNGDDMLSVMFQVVDGEYTGSKIFENFILTDAAKWKIAQFLKALGFNTETDNFELDPTDLMDKVCEVVTTVQDYNGQQNTKVKSFKATDFVA